jgi:hypothetical protein
MSFAYYKIDNSRLTKKEREIIDWIFFSVVSYYTKMVAAALNSRIQITQQRGKKNE